VACKEQRGFGIADLTRPRFRNREAEVDGNSKLQITNNKQITMTEIQKRLFI
jgi:hypothetical protein